MREEYDNLLVQAMDRVLWGAKALIAGLPERGAGEYLRLNGHNGMWEVENRPLTHPHRGNPFWEGFLAGKMWLLYDYAGDEAFRAEALRLSEETAPTRLVEGDINAGFSVYYSAGLGHDITGEEKLKAIALEGAETLTRLFHPKAEVLTMALTPTGGPCYESGVPPGGLDAIIDFGVPLALLWWAGQYRDRYRELAVRHMERIVELGLVREDGSTYQSLEIDPESGRPGKFHTHQGYGDETQWARGQAWAMLGYTMAHRAAGKSLFLETAVRCADWYVAHVPPDSVPFYDFHDPTRPRVPRDSCAAVIASTALVRLSEVKVDLARRYRPAVENTLKELICNYLSPCGLLLHGSWGGKHGLRVPQETIMPYGNYWIVECLHRELKPGSKLCIM